MRYLMLILLCCSVSFAADRADGDHKRVKVKRVLFIGNSYTFFPQKMLMYFKGKSKHRSVYFKFITKGGARLHQFVKPDVFKAIKTGKWDMVVLQEQSQLPGFEDSAGDEFRDAVSKLCKVIHSSGSKPVLYMTWGRLNGDKLNPHIYGSYDSMQKMISSGYRKAAEKNNADVIPVGEVWSEIMSKSSSTEKKKLYHKDGSHPSSKGNLVVCAVFFKYFFGDDLPSLNSIKKVVNKREYLVIKGAVDNMKG
jgi:hypothetical protein